MVLAIPHSKVRVNYQSCSRKHSVNCVKRIKTVSWEHQNSYSFINLFHQYLPIFNINLRSLVARDLLEFHFSRDLIRTLEDII